VLKEEGCLDDRLSQPGHWTVLRDRAGSSDALTYIPWLVRRNRLLLASPSPATLPPFFHSRRQHSSPTPTQVAPHSRSLSHDTFPFVRIPPHARVTWNSLELVADFPSNFVSGPHDYVVLAKEKKRTSPCVVPPGYCPPTNPPSPKLLYIPNASPLLEHRLLYFSVFH